MKPEIKAQWVAALRSGEYKQYRGVLTRTDDKGKPVAHCCLGVLCDLAVKAGVAAATPAEGRCVKVYHPVGTSYTASYYKDGIPFAVADDALLPQVVVDWAGLPSSTPMVNYLAKSQSYALTALNDHGTSFKEIADLIEKQL